MTTISNNIVAIQQKIANASQAAQRVDEVQLLAVSKTKPVALIKQAFLQGLTHFGENYVQESVEKILQIKDDKEFDRPLTWYFIGPLQSNKTRPVAENFDWVQSVDRLKIAQRLDQQRPEHLPAINICLQVNISGESSKSGTTLSEVMELAEQVQDLPRLKLRGIMAIPEKSDNPDVIKQQFKALELIYKQLQQQYSDIDTLSMGMSGDLESAIECGSTMVRIGTDIFGAR
ncbi:YggS family pyridoxal phosphate-dependent enzyme [Psychromonas algicola]|uniref:YggS family pyridoxal phosphate-dependent enzyme n=1 Tax=Psychromonas algicola TaxID=2555642 RepID=UPI001068B867|nr:YggS family pyridoxal phosphate-dependent enzyme [Psychromonas sp. RZ5]TEW51276.1 YggS family pyridoxal phosphate-dependent enzyme [Psychromonas sp. RZ5]